MILTPKNWKSFQHYKERTPAWIKLHKGLLTDFEFTRLPLASRALAPMLWLLASEYEGGRIDASLEKIAFRLHTSEAELQEALTPLIDSGFFDASELLAKTEHPAIPEKRREDREYREEREKEANASASPPPDPAIPEREYFLRGREVLGNKSGAMIANLLKAKGGNVALARAAIEQASQKQNPMEYIGACCKGGPIARPLTEFQRKQQETNDVRAELRNFANGLGGGGTIARILPDNQRERPEDVRSGASSTLLAIPGAPSRRGH